MLYALSFAFFNCLDSFVGVFLVILYVDNLE